MTPDFWDGLRDILNEALQRPPEQRPAFLDEACAGNLDLRAEIESLIEEDDKARNFLGGRADSEQPEQRRTFEGGEVVCGRFEVLTLLGEGGMGEVYRARDRMLEFKEVALKTIRADIAWNPGMRERLKQEVLLTRDIAHANVCPIYDLFEGESRAGPVRFFVMKLLDGETLAAYIKRVGPLQPTEALCLARQMAEGLTEAHLTKIVHRDFKPANVILMDAPGGKRAVITDFGLARSITPSEDGRSQSGSIAGTFGYMAPELLTGARATTAADVYAFGAVLYAMLTAEAPADVPPASRISNPSWRKVIGRCLERDPARRYGSPLEAIIELERLTRQRVLHSKWLALPAIAIALTAAGLTTWTVRERFFPLLPIQKHVAVLPLDVAEGDVVGRQIGQGIQETLSSELSRQEQYEKHFWVDQGADLRLNGVRTPSEAAKITGANLVILGNVTRTEQTVRLDLKLLNTATAKVLDSTTVMCPASQLYRLSEYAVEGAAHMLRITVRGEAQRLPLLAGTQNPDAYRLYEAAKAQMSVLDLDNVTKAIEQLQQAVNLDGKYALAYAKLAEAYVGLFHVAKQPDSLDLARGNSRKALELDSRPAAVHYSAALVLERTGELSAAEKAARRALELDPANTQVLALLARIYTTEKRPRDAEAAYRRALDIRPNYWNGYSLMGEFYYRQAKYEQAEKMFRTVLLIMPQNAKAHANLAGVLIARGRYAEAIEVLKRSIAIKESPNAFSNLGAAYYTQKLYLQAAEAMERAVELSPGDDVYWRNLGDAYGKVPGREADARKSYGRALELARRQLMVNERDPKVLTNLALYAAKMGDPPAARRWLARAAATNAPDAQLLFKQILAYEIAGDRPRALALIGELIKSGFPRRQILEAEELTDLRAGQPFQELIRVPPGARKN